MRRLLVIACASLSVFCGCAARRVERVVPPPLDAEAVTAAVMAKADADGDGLVRQNELGNVPALVGARAELDRNKDGGISKAELREWLGFVKDSEIAISQISGVVMHRQKPLANAIVTLLPEPFMGPDVAVARGVTDAEGRFAPTIPDGRYPGVNCGLYRVEISGTGNDGTPLNRFQGGTSPLGLAVGGMLPTGGVVTLTLDEPASGR